MKYSVALSEGINTVITNHLLRKDGQEDLCFALYAPGTGHQRYTGLIQYVILPNPGDRNVHGNVSFNSDYLDRVTQLALKKELGICFMHSHPGPGWQGMSQDDVNAEKMLAPRIKAITGLPLLGLTVGTDKTWSARFWIKTKPHHYKRHWCESVRTVGKGFRIDYANHLYPTSEITEEFTRTISAWGKGKQEDISRLKVGVVGLGSVGSIVAEALKKTGVLQIKLIDFDTIERKNLDRLLFMHEQNIGQLKVNAYKDLLYRTRIHDNQVIESFPYSIAEEEGLKAALDCDIIFSCVDRPWPRYILNTLSYANLIPVIDGGIDASINKTHTNLWQARAKAHTVGPHRRCLKCIGQYKSEDVALEMDGSLDDPTYIQGLPKDYFIHRGENVFNFSLSVAGMLMQQFTSLILQPRGVYYGPKEMDFVTGNIDSDFPFECDATCDSSSLEALGNRINQSLISNHTIASQSRFELAQLAQPKPQKSTITLSIISFINMIKLWLNKKFAIPTSIN